MKIICLLDRSGSMQSCISDTIGGYNSFLETSDPNDTISLYLFDHEFSTVYENVKVSEAPKLTVVTYRPRGTTALVDSLYKLLTSGGDDEKTTVVIITDGVENSSTEWTYSQVSSKIEEKKKLGWQFVFLGANQDAIESASRLNINEGCSLTFHTQNFDTAFRSVSQGIRRSQMHGGDLEFTQAERMRSLVTERKTS